MQQESIVELFALHRHCHTGQLGLCQQNRFQDFHKDVTFLLQRHVAKDCAHVTVGEMWFVEKIGHHHGQGTNTASSSA